MTGYPAFFCLLLEMKIYAAAWFLFPVKLHTFPLQLGY